MLAVQICRRTFSSASPALAHDLLAVRDRALTLNGMYLFVWIMIYAAAAVVVKVKSVLTVLFNSILLPQILNDYC
jgi:hypothetical protein